MREVIAMFKFKKEVKKEVKKEEPRGWYKGYYVRALRQDPEHVDYYLVAEYDKLQERKGVK